MPALAVVRSSWFCSSALVLIGLALPLNAWAQRTIRVPLDQPHIQWAIDVASDGDTVLVAPGTYFENIQFVGRAVTVRSSAGAARTTIDGSGQRPVVMFGRGENNGAVLSGFTIRNGGLEGGIYVGLSSPTIRDNRITDNSNCGIHLVSSPAAVVANNTIVNNLFGCPASPGGAGITIEGGSPLITGNTIQDNGGNNRSTSLNNTGGIAVGGSFGSGTPTISNNLIKRNQGVTGGGISIDSFAVTPVITQNVIVENVALQGGGIAINAYPAQSVSIISNTIANNESLSDNSGDVLIGNQAQDVSFSNNLIIGKPGKAAFACGSSTSSPVLESNDVFTAGGDSYRGCADLTGTNGNISVDPLFVDPNQSDYHLQRASPVIDRGGNSAADLKNDFSGYPRVADGDNDGTAVIDIGAFELSLVYLSPISVNFGEQVLATSSDPVAAILRNRGPVAVRISRELTGDIGELLEHDDCPLELPAGGSCTFTNTFTPLVLGGRSARLTVFSFDGQNQKPVAFLSLSGTGISQQSQLIVSLGSITFQPQRLGITSPPDSVSISQTGETPFVFYSITTTGPFAHQLRCVPANNACFIEVTFTPVSRGEATGMLIIEHNLSGSPTKIPLSGRGLAPVADISPLSLLFGGQKVGTSTSQTLTLRNVGDASLHINTISTTGDFAHTDGCFGGLGVGGSCTLTVKFTPTAAGPRSGTLTIASDSFGGSPTISLSGEGTLPVMQVSPPALSFGAQRIGTVSASQTILISNPGNASLRVLGITLVGDEFSQTNNCGIEIAPSSDCVINVSFRPTVFGFFTGKLFIFSDDPISPSFVAVLSGAGTMPFAQISPTVLAFAPQVINSTGTSQALTLTNLGEIPLMIFGISTTGDFAQSNTCGAQLPARSACMINVSFVPTSIGTRTGTLTILDDTAEGSRIVTLSGNGVTGAPTLSPASLSFGNQNVRKLSNSQAIKITASGPGPLAIFEVRVTEDFAQNNDCPFSLPAGLSCTVNVYFGPIIVGPRSGELMIFTNGLGSPNSASLTGTGRGGPH